MNQDGVVNSDNFDLFVQRADGLPGVRKSAPSTVRQVHPLTGVVSDHIIQTYKMADEGYVVLVSRGDAGGHYRIVLPGKVAEAIYRQRKALADRSTPESRKREREKREREKVRKVKAERRAGAQARFNAVTVTR